MKINWDKLRRERKSVPTKRSNTLNLLIKRGKKGNLDEMLKKFGWQKCPRCGGGRHPAFNLCKKCRSQNIIATAG